MIEAAGGVLIGATCLSPFGVGRSGVHSTPANQSPIHSIYSSECIADGLSAGAALVVASSFVSFALGKDTCGAGQVPAAYNHLVAIKPGQGIVSTRGFVPGCRSLECVSLLATCVSDAASVLDVLVDEDSEDPWSLRPQSPMRFARPFRFGVPREDQLDFHSDLDAEICFLMAIERLEGLGGICVDVDFSPFQEATLLADSGA